MSVSVIGDRWGVLCDLLVLEPEEKSRDDLIVVVRRQGGQIPAQAVQISELMETVEALTARLACLGHLLSRHSGNFSRTLIHPH